MPLLEPFEGDQEDSVAVTGTQDAELAVVNGVAKGHEDQWSSAASQVRVRALLRTSTEFPVAIAASDRMEQGTTAIPRVWNDQAS